MSRNAPAAGNDGGAEFRFELPLSASVTRGRSKGNPWPATGLLVVASCVLSVLFWRLLTVFPPGPTKDSKREERPDQPLPLSEMGQTA
jgi:hypothetical protein